MKKPYGNSKSGIGTIPIRHFFFFAVGQLSVLHDNNRFMRANHAIQGVKNKKIKTPLNYSLVWSLDVFAVGVIAVFFEY